MLPRPPTGLWLDYTPSPHSISGVEDTEEKKKGEGETGEGRKMDKSPPFKILRM